MRAFATARVIKGGEKRLTTAKRHAVRDEVWWAGVLDSECGKQGAVEVGQWDPGDPRSCIRCARILARDALVG